MSIKTFIIQAEDTAIESLKAAGHILENFVLSEGQKLVAEVKATGLGTTAMNIISALESHTATGAEKMEMLIAALAPALQKLKDAGGLKGLATSILDFAKEFAQSAFNDFAAAVPKIPAVATAPVNGTAGIVLAA